MIKIGDLVRWRNMNNDTDVGVIIDSRYYRTCNDNGEQRYWISIIWSSDRQIDVLGEEAVEIIE
jgi:hypothetical protein